MGRVQDKVTIVTGGARGIGRAACQRLADEGAVVVVTDRLEAEAATVAAGIAAAGGRARAYGLEVSRESAVASLVEEVVGRFGRIDVLVNNAGIAGPNKPTHEITEQEWDDLMAVNVKGVFFGTKHVVPHMMRTGGGSIINVSSIYGLIGAADAPAYHASKGAVRLMSKTDALLYAQHRIRVNSVHPGFIWTPMVDAFLQSLPDPAAARAAVDAKHPLGHMGEADDIAWGIVYLASDESRFVTGSELVIDGGYTAQ